MKMCWSRARKNRTMIWAYNTCQPVSYVTCKKWQNNLVVIKNCCTNHIGALNFFISKDSALLIKIHYLESARILPATSLIKIHYLESVDTHPLHQDLNMVSLCTTFHISNQIAVLTKFWKSVLEALQLDPKPPVSKTERLLDMNPFD